MTLRRQTLETDFVKEKKQDGTALVWQQISFPKMNIKLCHHRRINHEHLRLLATTFLCNYKTSFNNHQSSL